MDRYRFVPFSTAPGQSRRTLLGTILAATGTASGVAGAAGKKKKKKKRCKPPTTKCGKKACCQPGEACVDGQCAAPATPTTTTPAPLTTISCGGPPDTSFTGGQRFAQIFDASGSGLIATASFEVFGIAANTPFGVEIRTTQNGVPTTTVLGTAIIFGLPASAGTLPVTATFAPQVAVEQGQTYTLVITDVAKKGFGINGRIAGGCPRPFFADPQANNNFVAQTSSLIFTVSP